MTAIDPADIHDHAEGFYSAYREILGKVLAECKRLPPEIDVAKSHPVLLLASPGFVLEALALELYFKAIIYAETGVLHRNLHNLRQLFDKLPDPTQSRLVAIYDGAPEWHLKVRVIESEDGIPIGFHERLSLSANVFVEQRYLYEKKQPGSSLLNDIVNAVRQYVEEEHPHWIKRLFGSRL
ncbi:hypothetical protein [Sinorhizobium meliloti]|uniref:hypothetical protein n=1 Tax=Rhizobium meliloti TaxID=382 RepID=UPI000FDAAA56|nr:hypothetical protein [Sinorhizobium meliloti]RVH29420.1 hypothetical protein CN215_06975 [Sinorhizobium meliloti]